jgi:signal recognition particle receptor subunit beta
MGQSHTFLASLSQDSHTATASSNTSDLNGYADTANNTTKLIFAGTAVAGKNRAMELLSEIPVFGLTSATDTDDELRYGFLTLGDGQQLHLYGLPEQVPETMQDSLIDNALGMILLLDNQMANPLQDLRDYLDEFEDLIADTSLVIGIVHAEQGQTTLNAYHQVLNEYGYILPVFEIDATHDYDIRLMISALVHILNIN